jgi:hypothetical protein
MSELNPHQIQTINRKKRSPRLLAMLLIGPMVFLSILLPQSTGDRLQQDSTPEVVETETPEWILNGYPSEFIGNPEQTNGIVLGGVLLVIIIVGGIFSSLRRKKSPGNQTDP